MTTEPSSPSSTTNDSSRAIFTTRFKELLLALNTNSPVIRFSIIRELLNSYHFNMLNDNEIKYIIEQFQTKAVTASKIGKECSIRGKVPAKKNKNYYSAIFIASSKCCFTCIECKRDLLVGEPVVLLNENRWCCICGIEANPKVGMQDSFIKWRKSGV